MVHRRSSKNSKSLRRKSRRGRSRTRRGGGWSDGPSMVNPGNLVHVPYPGPGKDCAGNPHSIRPGYISDYNSKGLPGLSGGAKKRKSYGGVAMPNVAINSSYDPITNPNMPPVSASVTPKPGDFPDTTGVGGTVANPTNMPVTMSMPGVPVFNSQKQNGGRYGFFPGLGPLNPINGVGVTPAPFGRIPCESGTYNPLNPNPNGIQTMTTAPLTPPYVTRGGANFPVVNVGQVDSMRYNAPTAGYRNDFMTFGAPSAVPGLTIQTPYDAKSFNQACIKTGGGMKKYKKRRGGAGSLPVASDADVFIPVKMNEVMTRKDFDGSSGLLPVKFGGRRKTRRVLKKITH